MDLELITIEPQNALTIFTTPKAIDPFIDMVREAVRDFQGDPSTVKGRTEIKSMAHKVTKVKTHIEAVGKKLSADQKELPKKIDATRKAAWEALEALADEVRKPATEWDDAEAARIKGHEDALAAIVANSSPPAGENLTTLRALLRVVEAIEVGPEREEYEEAFARAKATGVAALSAAILARETYEAEQAELATLRAAAEELAKKDREDQIAKEAADKATRDAEAKAAAEKQRVEDEARREREAAAAREASLKQAAEDAEQRALQAAEKARLDQEAARAAEEAETKRRESNKAHRAKINREAMEALVAGGISEETAKGVLKLIILRQIPHVIIEY